MATGIEIAGLVLGALPLLLEGLKFYAEGVDTAIRFIKYRQGVKRLISELGAEQTVYHNSIKIMFHGVIQARDIEDFLTKPGVVELYDKRRSEEKLKQRLGSSFDAYLDTMLRMKEAIDAFKTKLKLNDKGKPQFTENDKNSFSKNYDRLKFSLKRASYADLMEQIRRLNSTLKDLTFQRQNIAQQELTTRVHVPNFESINRRAQGCYSAIRSGWTCPCHKQHSISLRLEPRMEDCWSDDEEDQEPMRDPFHVFFQYGHHQPAGLTGNVKTWLWDEADIQVTCERGRPSHVTPSSGRAVRFASQKQSAAPDTTPNATQIAVKAALDPKPDLQPIKDLCAAIGMLQGAQREVCLTLLHKEIARQKFGLKIFPTKLPPHDTELWSVSTLQSALQRGHHFRKRDRLRLGVTLASSVLQLHETAWLDEDWGIDNIYVIKRPGTSVYDHFFVSRHFDQTSLNGPKQAATRSVARLIRNRTLFALGVALIELWHGRALAELQIPEDEERSFATPEESALLTRYNTADRLADELEYDAEAGYSGAVRRCIRCSFDAGVDRFEDVKFRKAVFQDVVMQLQKNYKYTIGDGYT